MSAPLSSDESNRYASIIDAILATADLATITRKKVRQGLEKALGGKDLSDQKLAIKALIEARFDAISSQPQGGDAIPTPPSAPLESVEKPPKYSRHASPPTNGHYSAAGDDESEAVAEIEVSYPAEPVYKKQKRETSDEDADARLAAELQAQENQLARGRSTRGGGVSSKPKKKSAKRKSDKKVRDDSDADGSDDSGTPKKRKAGGGFQKEFNLSYPLAELVGAQQLSRPQVVKKLWEHIKANDLQDPKDKRQIRCDDKMQAVFKQSRVDMFQMNKLLGNQLYPLDE